MTTTPTTDTRHSAHRARWTIRFKIMMVFASVLLAAIGTQLYLAVSLFASDKLAYIYDLNASLVESLAEQAQTSLGVLAKEVRMFAQAGRNGTLSRDEQQALAKALFTHESEIADIEIYERAGAGFERRSSYVNTPTLKLLALGEADIISLRRERPLPFDAISSRPGTFFVKNASLPPDAALLTMAFALGSDGQRVAVVDFRHDLLLRTVERSRLHQSFLVDENGEVLAHPDSQLVVSRANLLSHPLVGQALRSPVQQGVIEFVAKDGSAQLGAYASAEIGQIMALTQISKAEALRASRQLTRQSSLLAVAILLAAFLATLFLSRRLTAPIRRLSVATESIGQGKFTIDWSGYANDEIGDLARAFERMIEQLKQTQSHLIQSERMAAFGALGAGITHEVKNPVTSLLGFAQLAQRKISDPEKVLELLKLIESQALRCRDLLQNFLKFARGGSGEWARLNPASLVEEAAKVLRHQLMIHRVQLEVDAGENVPDVMGNSGELQQVLVNLAVNAQQAMPSGGQVSLSVARADDGGAVIRVSDNGPGIPSDIKDRVFEPFFTTKAPGQGTGLGLSISFNIVRNHRGSISVESEPGKGATFSIHMPAAAAAAPVPSTPSASVASPSPTV